MRGLTQSSSQNFVSRYPLPCNRRQYYSSAVWCVFFCNEVLSLTTFEFRFSVWKRSCLEKTHVFASHYSALRSRSGVAPEGKGTGAWHSGKKWLSCTLHRDRAKARSASRSKMRGLCFRGEVATPSLLGINDAASEPRHPQIRNDDVAVFTMWPQQTAR